MTNVFTFDVRTGVVLERTCKTFGYPHKDSEGCTQYENTHFRTWEEASAKLIREIEAGLSLGTSSRTDLLARIRTIETQLADEATALIAAKRAAAERAGEHGR